MYQQPPSPAKLPVASTEGSSQGVFAMTIANRLPELWPSNVKIWLLHIESILVPQKISDEAMYQTVIAKLRMQDLEQVSDIISNPPENNKYKMLKERLIQVYEESEHQQFKKLMEGIELGDNKPSHLLRKMKELAGNKISEQAMKFLWGSHLPKAIRTVLAIHEKEDLNKLAEMADRIMLENDSYQSVKYIDEIKQTPQQTENFQMLHHMIMELSNKFERMSVQNNNRYTSRRDQYRSSSPHRTRSNSRNNKKYAQKPTGLCYYHYRFKSQATRCKQPCSWQTQNKQSDNQKN